MFCASTYEYEVCVTTEMPPSGSVEVRVAVTNLEDGDAEEESAVLFAVVVFPAPAEVAEVVGLPADEVAVTRVVSNEVVATVLGESC